MGQAHTLYNTTFLPSPQQQSSEDMPPAMDLQFHTTSIHGASKSQGRHSTGRKFVGVRQRPSGKWVAEIKNTTKKIRMWLGTFDTAEEAACAYDEAACLLRGSNVRTNFFNTIPCNPALSLKIRNLFNEKRGLNKAFPPSQTASSTKPTDSSNNTGGLNPAYLEDANKPHSSCLYGEPSSPRCSYSDHVSLQQDGFYVQKGDSEVINEAQFSDFKLFNDCNDPCWDFPTLCQMFCQS